MGTGSLELTPAPQTEVFSLSQSSQPFPTSESGWVWDMGTAWKCAPQPFGSLPFSEAGVVLCSAPFHLPASALAQGELLK